jgi:surfactin synthase thioesterase subunit
MASPTSQPTIKPNFWRIQNITISEKQAALDWLREQVKELAIPEGEGFSLAPVSKRTLCATVTSCECPLPGNRDWHVDDDFIGFTPLSDPADATVDIVAVTGLGGHALGSFRSSGGASVWLRDFAPKDIPQARFITYGYNTAVTTSDSNQGIRELAHTLLDGLANFRKRTQTQQRPLLFFCHSLGGVVLKEALVMSSKATGPEHKRQLEVMTMAYGLVFMGVPNLGLKHHQLKTMVEGRPNEDFVRDLLVRSDGEASQFLSYLTDEFVDLNKRRRLPFQIVSYYETVSSPTVVVSVPNSTLK